MKFKILVLLLTFTSLSVFAQNGKKIVRPEPVQVAAVMTSPIGGPVGNSANKTVVMSDAKVLYQSCPQNPLYKCQTSRTATITQAELLEIQRLAFNAVNNPEQEPPAPTANCLAVPTTQSTYFALKENVYIGLTRTPCGGSEFKNQDARQLARAIQDSLTKLEEESENDIDF